MSFSDGKQRMIMLATFEGPFHDHSNKKKA
jgi:hypothetical protein